MIDVHTRRPLRSLGMIIVAAAVLVLAGCGGSGGRPTASGSPSSGSYVAYSACMRSPSRVMTCNTSPSAAQAHASASAYSSLPP